MLKTVIRLPDGTELSSGVGQTNVIQSITVTQCVNAGEELTVGSCCANMAEVKLLTPGGGANVAAGDELTIYRVAENGTRYQIGVFIAEKPTRPTANSMSITAYDRVVKMDQDLTQWLAELTQWPYHLLVLAEMVCEKCGLSLKNEEIPNGEYPVKNFSGEGITGRQIMQWIGQVAGRFCRATADGEIEFAWYEPLTTHNIGVSSSGGGISYANGNLTIACGGITAESNDAGDLAISSEQMTVTDDGNGNVVLVIPESVQTVMYYQNGLSFEDYTVAAIEKVQLRQNEEDVGTVYPDGLEGERNTYIITGNPLLTALSADDLVPVAQTLYEILKDVSYTPCKVSVPANMNIRAGHTVQITDRNGKTITAYVMTKTQKGQKDTLECTGSPKRDSTTVVNNRSYADLQGKVLNLRTDLDGVYVELSKNAESVNEAEKRMRSLIEQTEENIKCSVEQAYGPADDLKGEINRLASKVEASVTAEQMSVAITKEMSNGVNKVKTSTTGYTFDDTGLTVAKSDSVMKTQITENGMTVYKNGQEALKANDQGVEAVDLKATTYLIVGKNSRFEDLPDGKRTGCFWIGE